MRARHLLSFVVAACTGFLTGCGGVEGADQLSDGPVIDDASPTDSDALAASADWTFNLTNIPLVSGGDCDVYTKSGRQTDVAVGVGWTNDPYTDPIRIQNGNQVCVLLYYRVHEHSSNYTTLEKWEWTCSPIYYSYQIMGHGGTSYYQTFPIYGEFHGEYYVPNQSGTVLSEGYARIDGSGCDNQGNAYVRGRIIVPIEVAPLY